MTAINRERDSVRARSPTSSIGSTNSTSGRKAVDARDRHPGRARPDQFVDCPQRVRVPRTAGTQVALPRGGSQSPSSGYASSWPCGRRPGRRRTHRRLAGQRRAGGCPAGGGPGSPLAAPPGSDHRIWSNEIPQRNLHFTGRVDELEALRANLTQDDRPHPAAQLISGMGGVGKTEIATEYIHRHRDKYEIIWWIRAEQTDRVRDALVKLGQRLEVGPAGTESGRDRTIAAVLEALASGPAELAAGLRRRGRAS